jgi:thymidylate kinase
MAKVLVVEGPDKVGKETQSKMLERAFVNAGYRTLRVEVPSKSCPRTHALIYKMLHDGSAKRWPNFFQFVQFLNKFLFQLLVMPALLKNVDILILDRWSLSAIIYGNATGVNLRFNEFLYNRLMKPDMTLVFHGKSYRRLSADDSYEKDADLQEKVAIAYHTWGVKHPHDHLLVNNERSVEEIHSGILIDLCMRGIP